MLGDRDPNGNASGRTSRASNMSAMSRAPGKHAQGAGNPDVLSLAGVSSMLRTSTEVGNLDLSGRGSIPRAQPRLGASSRMSTASSISNNSSRTSRNHRQHPSSASAAQRSLAREQNVPQYVPDTLSPTMMNIPGTSPLVPPGGRERDAHRSRSMTHTIQPNFGLSSNRSLGSLRHEHYQQPKTPYNYPARLRRHDQRPGPPVLSDMTGTHPRRNNGPGLQGQPYYAGQPGVQGQPYYAGQPGVQGHHYYPGQPGVQGHHYYPGQPYYPGQMTPRMPSDASLGQQESARRKFNRPSRGPSPARYRGPQSDTPPVPSIPQRYKDDEQHRKQAESGKGSVSSGSTNLRTDSDTPSSDMALPPTPKDSASMEVLPSRKGSQMIFDNRTRAVREQISSGRMYYDYNEPFEREHGVDPSPTSFVSPSKTNIEERGPSVSSAKPSVESVRSQVPSLAELSASPAAPRITKDLIREAVEPSSTSGDTETSMRSPAFKSDHATTHSNDLPNATGPTNKERDRMLHLQERGDNSLSIQSQTGSRFLDSSTVNFVASMATGVGLGTELASEAGSKPSRPVSPGPSTDDGYSELLARYQHTDSKQETSVMQEAHVTPKKGRVSTDQVEKKSNHAQQSSDQQSFKSATDILPAPSVKEADARSFTTCKDGVTPDRVVPISGSSSTLSVPQQPPSVPPRESSSSEDAQRHRTVHEFLRRGLPARLTVGRQPIINDETPKTSEEASPIREPTQEILESRGIASSMQLSVGVTKDPEKASTKQGVALENQSAPSIPLKECDSSTALGVGATPASQQHSFGSPSPNIPEPSSVYSPQDNSSRSRVHPSPAGVPKSPEYRRRDSQTTTHLDWPGRHRSLNGPLSSGSEPYLPLASVQEDTTTDLRLPGFRYAAAPHNLPDLKEESHEDSSLNTSASNLKNSHFRFQNVGPLGVRPSVDDAVVLSRSSVGSHRHSAQGNVPGQAHGLPPMEFSQGNLLEKMKDELGLQPTRSLKLSTAARESNVEEDGLQREASVEELHKKYRSPLVEVDEKLKKSGDSTQPTTVTDLTALTRSRSPKQFMEEVDQLPVPSVKGLEERFYGIINPPPCGDCKVGEESEVMEEERIVEEAKKKIHEVGGLVPKGSIARLRPVPGSPDMVPFPDDLYEDLMIKHKENGSPDCQGDGAAKLGAGEVGLDAKGKGRSVTHTLTRQNAPHAELETPSPAISRPRSRTVGNQELRPSGETTLSSRRSLSSFASTPTATDTRPWNYDKNYPWATTTVPAIDISLPQPGLVRHSPRPGPSHLRNRLSDAPTASSLSSAITATTSPFGTTSGSNAHAHQHHFSNFGRVGDQPHKSGERYPTTGLTPPTAIFRDHDPTLDTSDDEDFDTSRNKGKLSLRKRFSSARTATLDNATRAGRAKTNALELASPKSAQQSTTSILQDRAGEASAFTTQHRHTFRDAEGMRPVEYHRNSILNRLTRLWDKGSQLFRKYSRRNRQDSTTV